MQEQITSEKTPPVETGMCRHNWTASFCGTSNQPVKCLYCTVTDLKATDWLDDEALQVSEKNAFLEDINHGGKIPLQGFIFRIGRLESNHIVVEDDSVSRSHAVITAEDNLYFIQDLGSTNGTLLNGSPLRKREKLSDHDVIRVGQIRFEFSCTPVMSHFPNASYAPAG